MTNIDLTRGGGDGSSSTECLPRDRGCFAFEPAEMALGSIKIAIINLERTVTD
jgi:hypothetical protein